MVVVVIVGAGGTGSCGDEGVYARHQQVGSGALARFFESGALPYGPCGGLADPVGVVNKTSVGWGAGQFDVG